MIDIENVFYNRIQKIISSWSEEDIYAISFFVESNEEYKYKGLSNLTNFAVSYNTESDCDGAGKYDEERWNYAFWRQDEEYIVDIYNTNDGTKELFQWYAENNIDNIGYEDDDCYDEQGQYIGKGPVGHYELLCIASNIAKRLQEEKFLVKKFGKRLPIIVHGLEYAWYDIEATKNANPEGEASTFIEALKRNEMM